MLLDILLFAAVLTAFVWLIAHGERKRPELPQSLTTKKGAHHAPQADP